MKFLNTIQNKIPDSHRILITGITSIHGWPIFARLQELLPQHRLFGIKPPKIKIPQAENILSFCITDQKKLEKIRNEFKPTHVIHCAGVCDLDVCEDRPEWAFAINVLGTKTIADVFGKDTPIIYMSTDLVFSGDNPPSKGYSEDDLPDPVSIAGTTFAQAEKHVQRCREHCLVKWQLQF